MRSDLRWWLVLVAVLGTLAAAPGAFVRSTYGGLASVDEPQYLLTAISLWEDQSLDIDDELDDERWRTFHQAQLPRQTQPQPDGSQVAPHDPLLSLLLALPYELGGVTGARWLLALVNGVLAAALLHLAHRRFAVGRALATVGALTAATSVPFVVYGSQLYPELPAALAVTLAVDAGLAAVHRRSTAVVAVAVITLPWLSVKYVPVAAVVALLHLWRLHRDRDIGHRNGLLATYVGAGITYLAAHLAWYGGLTVYAAGDFFVEQGSQFSVLGTRPNPLGRSRRLVGLLVDRGFGIAAWQPAWLALLPAMGAIAVRRPPRWTWLAAPLLVGWAGATWAAVTMHGYWFPGRHVLHALPLAVVLVLWWVQQRGPRLRAVVAAAAGLGIWATAGLLSGGLAGDLTFVVDFAGVDHPGYQTWSRLLPDHYARPSGIDASTATWILLAVAAITAGAVMARHAGTGGEQDEQAPRPPSAAV